MILRISDGQNTYDCTVYDTKPTTKALELVNGGTTKYVAVGNTSKNTPVYIQGAGYILSDAIKDTPATAPYITATGYGTVTLESDAGTYITYNGESKASGSTWTHNSFTEYQGDAVAYYPTDSTGLQSANTSGLWIGILGKPRNAGADAHWDNYGIVNQSGLDITFHVTGTTSHNFTYEGYSCSWYFKATSGTLLANGGVYAGDLWEANGVPFGGSNDGARADMWAGYTYYHATKTGWIDSYKERVKADLP